MTAQSIQQQLTDELDNPRVVCMESPPRAYVVDESADGLPAQIDGYQIIDDPSLGE